MSCERISQKKHQQHFLPNADQKHSTTISPIVTDLSLSTIAHHLSPSSLARSSQKRFTAFHVSEILHLSTTIFLSFGAQSGPVMGFLVRSRNICFTLSPVGVLPFPPRVQCSLNQANFPLYFCLIEHLPQIH